MGNKQNFYFEDEVTIPAGGRHRVSVWGRYLTILEYTGSDKIRFQINDGHEERLRKGISIELPPMEFFKSITFRNAEGSAIDIEFCITEGRVYDSRFVPVGAIDTNPSVGSTLANFQYTIGTSNQLILPANSDRRGAFITNTGSYDAAIGATGVNSNPLSASGAPLPPGASVYIETTAAIYAKAQGNTNIAVLEID